MKKLMAKYSSSVLSIVAVAFVSVACPAWVHNPKVPQELLSK
jgi:cyclic lactone autoinducer peptide